MVFAMGQQLLPQISVFFGLDLKKPDLQVVLHQGISAFITAFYSFFLDQFVHSSLLIWRAAAHALSKSACLDKDSFLFPFGYRDPLLSIRRPVESFSLFFFVNEQRH